MLDGLRHGAYARHANQTEHLKIDGNSTIQSKPYQVLLCYGNDRGVTKLPGVTERRTAVN